MSSPATLRFLCDEMLGRLARYLRAAGYDTTLAAGGLRDSHWLALAREQHRLFLTCDRGVADHNAARATAIILPRGTLQRAASELSQALAIDWLKAPFTRCLVDNTELVALIAEQALRLPRDVAAHDARHCRVCGRVYWSGSHHRRMQRRLAAWAAGDFDHPC